MQTNANDNYISQAKLANALMKLSSLLMDILARLDPDKVMTDAEKERFKGLLDETKEMMSQ